MKAKILIGILVSSFVSFGANASSLKTDISTYFDVPVMCQIKISDTSDREFGDLVKVYIGSNSQKVRYKPIFRWEISETEIPGETSNTLYKQLYGKIDGTRIDGDSIMTVEDKKEHSFYLNWRGRAPQPSSEGTYGTKVVLIANCI